ncbi:hypothetical protein D6774_04630 [Candidatus Woesearchaeota archaeon]|nr:MAG: hypothetical protein D6774_04630 [Candidatus Woesearchaeota archaeon]
MTENIAQIALELAYSPKSRETDIGRAVELRDYSVFLNTKSTPPFLWIAPRDSLQAVYVCKGMLDKDGSFVPLTSEQQIRDESWLHAFEKDILHYNGASPLELFLHQHPRVKQVLENLSVLGTSYF